MDLQFDDDYKKWLASVKTDFRRSQIKAATKANSELVAFNWRLVRSICLMRAEAKWGNGFFNTLSRDLKELLPESKGFSQINLRYMERFYRLFPDRFRPQTEGEINVMLNVPQLGGEMKGLTNVPQVGEEILPQVGAEIFMIPWNHVKYIIDKCDDDSQKALFYIQETIKNNWSRAILLNFLGTDLYERKGRAVTNFSSTHHPMMLYDRIAYTRNTDII